MVIALLLNVSDNSEILDNFNGEKRRKGRCGDILRRVLLGQGKQVDI